MGVVPFPKDTARSEINSWVVTQRFLIRTPDSPQSSVKNPIGVVSLAHGNNLRESGI